MQSSQATQLAGGDSIAQSPIGETTYALPRIERDTVVQIGKRQRAYSGNNKDAVYSGVACFSECWTSGEMTFNQGVDGLIPSGLTTLFRWLAQSQRGRCTKFCNQFCKPPFPERSHLRMAAAANLFWFTCLA